MFAGLANASLSVGLIAETLWTNFWQCSQNRRLSSPGILSQSAEHRCLIVQGEVFDFIGAVVSLNDPSSATAATKRADSIRKAVQLSHCSNCNRDGPLLFAAPSGLESL